MNAAIRTTGLGKRYSSRRPWALRDCTLEVAPGTVVGLIGPNGAGKTTLLHLVAGLLRPTAGTAEVFGLTPGDPEVLPRVGFVAQDVPLYRSFTVHEMLEFGRHMNPRWDDRLARSRLEGLAIPLDERVGHLSGGQRAQVGLAVAMAKRPDLLLLDEPLASLDPLARRSFLQALMAGIAEHGTTVVLSSHLVADLERVCDHVIVLHGSRTQVAGPIEDLLEEHRVVRGPRLGEDERPAGVGAVIQRTDTDRQTTMLVRTNGAILDPDLEVTDVGLEDLVLAYLGQPDVMALPAPRLAPTGTEAPR